MNSSWDFQNHSYQGKIDFQKLLNHSYQGAEFGFWNYFRNNNFGFFGVTDFEIWEFRSIWKRGGTTPLRINIFR